MVFSNIFMFTPYLGKWSNLTNIFQDRLKPPTSWFLLVLFGWSQDVSKSLTGFLCFWVQDFLGLSFLSSSALWELDCGMGWDSKNTFEKRGWNRIWIVWPFFGHDFWSTLLLFFFFGQRFPKLPRKPCLGLGKRVSHFFFRCFFFQLHQKGTFFIVLCHALSYWGAM